MLSKICLLLLIFLTPQAKEISKDGVLQVAQETKIKIDSITSYKFTLVKRELIRGRDTGYQYIDVKVQAKPLQIYIKFLHPEQFEGREGLFRDGYLLIRNGGIKNSNLILDISPDSPLAMNGNKYPITHFDPTTLSTDLMKKIAHELDFKDTIVSENTKASVYEHKATHYRLVHKTKEEGQICQMAEVLISHELGIPIYFRLVGWSNKVLEEYAFKDMELNVKFDSDTFDENNPNYKLKREER